jgi:hypothetical protein
MLAHLLDCVPSAFSGAAAQIFADEIETSPCVLHLGARGFVRSFGQTPHVFAEFTEIIEHIIRARTHWRSGVTVLLAAYGRI